MSVLVVQAAFRAVDDALAERPHPVGPGALPFGIAVPAETISRVADAEDPAEEAYRLVLEQSRHALSLPGVRGLHLTDFRKDGSMERLCRDLGIPPRSERSTTRADHDLVRV